MSNLVSVVIPCFNAGMTLGEAIESVLRQTYADIEIIVVDDGSTDLGTREIIASAHWPKTRVIHQENAGPAAARNRAIEASSGEFILPLDADDTIEPTYVEKAVAAMRADANVGIVYCKALKFGAESGPWGLPAYSLRELVIDNVIFVTSLFRRADWELVNGFNQSLRRGVEDYEFWVKIVALGRDVIQLDEYLFNYRIQQTSRTTNFSSDRAAVVATYAHIFRDNVQFFAKNAEYLFEHRFGLYDELLAYRARYGWINGLIERHPWLKSFARACHRLLFRLQ
ncbi:glycosyltransferase family 2 protein [Pseudoxanthomonas helianthi]|uniref:Glycosyltransferase family 2 protein n=1 Tax=Pseudoxanthomonas helianthi TaxID=1453541 RepID=A0A940X2P9_9GAMM|nr:glycosyltransferase family A protein [Pseudoxanthomonas helianthi]MBP3983143.1 glycosyltransferase family 2 protein [Pseudoxanthomonas helianthi]